MPFAYEPPPGFVAVDSDGSAELDHAKAWIPGDAEKKNFDGSVADRSAQTTRVVLTHSNKSMSVEEADLSKLATEMPKAFEGSCAWVHRRHEMRTRVDGARVGLIEGDCDREIDLSAFGLPSQKFRARKLQLMFPDDGGTSIVTASYPSDQASRWEPLFEATIGTAKGVATRAPAPAPFTYLAWSLAGAMLGWFATALVKQKANAPQSASAAKGAEEGVAEKAGEDAT